MVDVCFFKTIDTYYCICYNKGNGSTYEELFIKRSNKDVKGGWMV